MDELIIRSLQGRATEADARALRVWCVGSQSNARRYWLISRLWQLTELARGASLVTSLPMQANQPEGA